MLATENPHHNCRPHSSKARCDSVRDLVRVRGEMAKGNRLVLDISHPDASVRLAALRSLKNSVIGNRANKDRFFSNKLELASQLLLLLRSSAAIPDPSSGAAAELTSALETLRHAAVLVGSLAFGSEVRASSLVKMGFVETLGTLFLSAIRWDSPSEQQQHLVERLAEACARSIRHLILPSSSPLLTLLVPLMPLSLCSAQPDGGGSTPGPSAAATRVVACHGLLDALVQIVHDSAVANAKSAAPATVSPGLCDQTLLQETCSLLAVICSSPDPQIARLLQQPAAAVSATSTATTPRGEKQLVRRNGNDDAASLLLFQVLLDGLASLLAHCRGRSRACALEALGSLVSSGWPWARDMTRSRLLLEPHNRDAMVVLRDVLFERIDLGVLTRLSAARCFACLGLFCGARTDGSSGLPSQAAAAAGDASCDALAGLLLFPAKPLPLFVDGSGAGGGLLASPSIGGALTVSKRRPVGAREGGHSPSSLWHHLAPDRFSACAAALTGTANTAARTAATATATTAPLLPSVSACSVAVSAIVRVVLPVILQVVAVDDPPCRAAAVAVLSELVVQHHSIAEAAADGDTVSLLVSFLSCALSPAGHMPLPAASPTPSAAVEPSFLLPMILRTLAAIASVSADARKQLADLRAIPQLVGLLASPAPEISRASCDCLRALSRSVGLLRTSLFDAHVAKAVFDLLVSSLRRGTSSLAAARSAVLCLCNLLAGVSPMQQELLSLNVLPTLAECLRIPSLCLATVWALANLSFFQSRGSSVASPPDVRRDVVAVCLAGGVLRDLWTESMASSSTLQLAEKVALLTRNLTCCGSAELHAFFSSAALAPEDLFKGLVHILARYAAEQEGEALAVHAWHILANVSVGAAGSPSMLTPLVLYVQEEFLSLAATCIRNSQRPSLQLATLWFLMNFCWDHLPAVLSSSPAVPALLNALSAAQTSDNVDVQEQCQAVLKLLHGH